MNYLEAVRNVRRFLGFAIREIVLPVVGVVVPIITVVFFTFDIQKFHDEFVSALLIFFVSILWYHLYYFNIRDRLTSNSTKHIDYIYLSAASLGLLASADLSIKKYDEQLRQHIAQARSYMRFSSEEYSKYVPEICADPLQVNDCKNIRELIEDQNRFFSFIGEYKDYYNFSNGIRRLKAKDDQIKFRPEFIEYHEDSYRNLEALVNRLSKAPFGYKTVDDFDQPLERWRSLGFMLIAAALGLRITKVTIEILGWGKNK